MIIAIMYDCYDDHYYYYYGFEAPKPELKA